MTTPSAPRPVPCEHLLEPCGERQAPVCYLDLPLSGCPTCAEYRPGISAAERTRCEVWTRVMGYHRPVAAFNAGKRAEHQERLYFAEAPTGRRISYQEGAGHD